MNKIYLGGVSPNNKGFTLAEVLVTLAVIGVIASLTIPSLFKKYEKQQWISGYKSTYSIVNQATRMIMVDNTNSLLDAWGGIGDHQGMYNAYSPYLKIIKKCENQTPENNCFASSYTYMSSIGNVSISPYSDYSVMLSNGSSLAFYSMQGADQNGRYNRIYIDTNGKKGPNIYGKDLNELQIRVSSDPVKPYGAPGYSNSTIISLCNSNLAGGLGHSCGIRILRGDYGEDY